MKRFSKKIVVTLTSLLLASSMVVSASAASVAFGTSNFSNVICISSSGSGCQSGYDENSILGYINTYGDADPSGESSSCSQAESVSSGPLSDVINTYMSAAINAAKQNSACGSANEENGSDCTSANAAATPAPSAVQSPDNSAASAKNAGGTVTAQQSACDTGTAGINTDSSSCPVSVCPAATDKAGTSASADEQADSCAAASSCPTGDCTTNTCAESSCGTSNCTASGGQNGIFSCFSFTACKQSITNLLNSIFAKCGINVCLPGCSDSSDSAETPEPSPTESETAATPQPSDSGDTTTAPTTPSPTNTSNPEAASPSGSDSDTAGSSSADNLAFEQQVVALVNEQRAAYGLSPLTLNETLSDVARAKSQDMHDNNYFSHTSPTYGSPFEMMSSFGITYRAAGENIAMGYTTPEAVMNAWINSEGHRANILNASFTQIGVGYVADGNYWTQEFIG